MKTPQSIWETCSAFILTLKKVVGVFFLMLEQDLLCSSLCPVSGKSLDSSFQPYQVFVHVDVYNLLFSGLDDPTSPSLSSCDGCSDP